MSTLLTNRNDFNVGPWRRLYKFVAHSLIDLREFILKRVASAKIAHTSSASELRTLDSSTRFNSKKSSSKKQGRHQVHVIKEKRSVVEDSFILEVSNLEVLRMSKSRLFEVINNNYSRHHDHNAVNIINVYMTDW